MGIQTHCKHPKKKVLKCFWILGLSTVYFAPIKQFHKAQNLIYSYSNKSISETNFLIFFSKFHHIFIMLLTV